MSEVIDISPSILDSSLCFIQPGISHDVLCIEIKLPGCRYTALMYSFPYLDQVCCFMFNSNCCFLTCIRISQEAGKVVWYVHLFETFPHFFVIHIVKVFSLVNEAEVDVFLELFCFFFGPVDVDNLISGSSAFSISSLNIWKFMVHILLKTGLENFERYFASI